MSDLPKNTVENRPEQRSPLLRTPFEAERPPAKSTEPGTASDAAPAIDVKGPIIAIGVCLYVLGVGWMAVRSFGYLSFSEGILPYLIALAGFLVFYIRQKFRLAYGILEALFGIALCLVDLPDIPTPLVDSLSKVLGSISLAKELAGLYVIVRGLDNVGKAIKQYPDALSSQTEPGWSSIIPSFRISK